MSKVSPGTLTVVLFAMLAGLGGAFVVRQQLAQPRPELPPLPEISVDQTYYIPVASVDLEHGHTLSFGDIAILKFTPEELAASKYAGQPYMRETDQIIGRTLQVPTEQGAVFMPNILYPEGMGPGIAERLRRGYRGVTVAIENVGAVQGFARPGSVVDVLFRSKQELDRPEMTLTLLERIEVLAINASLLPNRQVDIEKDSGTVTLAVTPQQAKILKVVEDRGELSLTLRNPEDDLEFAPFDLGDLDPAIGQVAFTNERTETLEDASDRVRSTTVDNVIESTEQVTLDDLLGIPRQAPKKQMEIFRGGDKQIVEFDAQENSRQQVIQRSGRIQTPIAHEVPPRPRGAVDTAQVDYRSRSANPRAVDVRSID